MMDIKYLAEQFEQAKALVVIDADEKGLHQLRWLGYDCYGSAFQTGLVCKRETEDA